MSDRSESKLRAIAADAADALSAADADLREMRYWTDDELRIVMRDRAAREKTAIREAVEDGRIFVVAGSDIRRVHHHDCSSLRDQTDRDRAWSPFQNDPEYYRQEVAHGSGLPKMPQLLSRAQVEALPTYVTCRTCSPTLDHPRKTRGERSTKLSSFGARHIGRNLRSVDGSDLGRLEGIMTMVTASGTAVTLLTSLGAVNESQHAAVCVLPADN